MKTLLIAISTTILLLFTSCEDEMGVGGTGGGGGKEDANTITRSTLSHEDNEIILVTETILTVDKNPYKQ